MKTEEGILVTFEGIDGSGKSTQARMLSDAIEGSILTREPGGCEISEQIREVLLKNDSISITTELLLIMAARAQLVEELIKPALDDNEVVICDRYTDCSIAYQGYRSGHPIGMINLLNRLTSKGVEPNLTFILDMDVEKALERKLGSSELSRFEKEGVEVFERVKKGYDFVAETYPYRVKVIDADQPIEVIHSQIFELYTNYIEESYK